MKNFFRFTTSSKSASAQKGPGRHTHSQWIARLLRRVASLGLLACAALALTSMRVQALDVTFDTPADIPVSTTNYTASGELHFTLGFTPAPGTNLTVIKNTGLHFISGQFSNLPNGAKVNLTHNGTFYPFVAWYYGGEGNNDLVLLWPHTGLAAWGNNTYGQLGDKSATQRQAAVDVVQTGVLPGKTVVQLASGFGHTLALCSDGTVAAWGLNNYGQLGDNTTLQRILPVAVNSVSGTSVLAGKTVISVAAGDAHSVALCSDGTVAVWGRPYIGAPLGSGPLVPVLAPSGALSGKTVVAVAAGGAHSLALRSDGTVVSWGSNRYGQLGNNNMTDYHSSVAVNAVAGTSALFAKTVVAIAAGRDHSLALCTDGTVTTWGKNDQGQLGDNSLTNRLAPVAVDASEGSALPGTTVIAIAAGNSYSLALDSNGRVAAWGDNAYGQLGDDSLTDCLIPKAVNTGAGSALFGGAVVAITAGGIYSQALGMDGTVTAWGNNVYGQLGDNSTTQRLLPVFVNMQAGTSVLSNRKVSGLAVSSLGYHSSVIYGKKAPEILVEVLEPGPIVLTDQESTVSFGSELTALRTFQVSNTGDAALGPLSARVTGADAASFTVLSQPSPALVSGGTSTFRVAFTGTSPGSKSTTLEITSNDPDEPLFRISLTGTKPGTLEVSFAAATDIPLTTKAVDATGTDLNITLGFAPAPGTNLTVIKNTGPTFITGQFSNMPNGATVNLTHNGTTYPFVAWYYGGERHNELVLLWPHTGLASWAFNISGRAGGSHTMPVGVVQAGALQGKTIVQVVRNTYGNLALCSDGTLVIWTSSSYGGLGSNGIISAEVPVAVSMEAGTSALAGKTVVAIAAGSSHWVALCSDGTLAAWGNNFDGQLGDNSYTNRAVPVAVNVAAGSSALAGRKVVAISAGESHNLALCSDGTLVTWGSNFYGQLQDNSTVNRRVPVVASMSKLTDKSVVAIAAGGNHNLVLCDDGSVVTWGRNTYGQLGNGAHWSVTSGLLEIEGKNVVAIAAGRDHSLALCSDGTVQAWGLNTDGQLGDYSTINRNRPVAVNVGPEHSALAGRSVIAITAGEIHGLALCSDGTVAAWGANTTSVGYPGRQQHLFPVDISSGSNALSGKRLAGLCSSPQAFQNIVIHGLTSPPVVEMALTGNGVIISQDDLEPSAADSTDFGSAILAGQQVSHAFTIRNQGNIALHLAAPMVSLSGTDVNAFTLSHAPLQSIDVGGITRFIITFDPRQLGTHTATVTIRSTAHEHPIFSFGIRGFGTLSKARSQTLAFTPLANVYVGQGSLSLSAYASSGLPVSLSVVPAGTKAPGAAIVGNELSFTGPGTVKIQATQAGDAFYAAAPAVVKTITVKANPAALTLLNLAQTFTGTPRAITTAGGTGPVTVEYKVLESFDPEPPTYAGSYLVRASDTTGTKTGTLVIGKAPLYVTPDNQSKFVGQDNPELSFDYHGWVPGPWWDKVITAPPVARTTATKGSAGGLYPITVSGGKAPANYFFVYQQATLAVDTFVGTYETLVESELGCGKLVVTVTAANKSFTGKLSWSGMKSAISLSGKLYIDYDTQLLHGQTLASTSNPFNVFFAIKTDGSMTTDLYRENSLESAGGTGRRLLALASGKTVSYSGAHTAVLEPISPARTDLPAGAGWATAAISTKGVMTLAGRLGDGTSFTSSLAPDDFTDPGYRLFAQPYKTGAATRLASYVSGAFTLLPHPSLLSVLAGRRYVESAALTWTKTSLPTDTSYRAGFGSDNAVLMLDPWLPPVAAKGGAPAITLLGRLGLTNNSFQVLHGDTGSMLNDTLPSLLGLGTTNAVTVTTPAANATKWKATVTPATGLFSGSFELADTDTKPRVVNFTGILRQPVTAEDNLIGDGHYLLPPLEGTEKRTGEVLFVRP